MLLFERGPDAMHIIVIVENLQELADIGAIFVREGGELLGCVAKLASDNSPAVCGEPFRNGGAGRAICDEASADAIRRDVVILHMGQRAKIVCAGLDGGCLEINVAIGVVRLNQAYMIEEEFVASRRRRAVRA